MSTQPPNPNVAAVAANITQAVKAVAISAEFPGLSFPNPSRTINVRELHWASTDVPEDYIEVLIDGKRNSVILVNPKFVP